MMGISAYEIMEKAVMLEERKRIIIPCSSYTEMESMRSNLYRARNVILKKNRAMAYSLQISREVGDNKWCIIVTKELTVDGLVIMSEDGSVEPFTREAVAIIGNETEADRMSRLMKEDGMSEEEIADALAEKGIKDFDEAAAKIEEAQGLAPEPE